MAVTPSRPPLDMKMIVDDLKLTEPIAAFNGGFFINPDFSPLEENVLPEGVDDERDLEQFFQLNEHQFSCFDLVMLGMGANGHTNIRSHHSTHHANRSLKFIGEQHETCRESSAGNWQ